MALYGVFPLQSLDLRNPIWHPWMVYELASNIRFGYDSYSPDQWLDGADNVYWICPKSLGEPEGDEEMVIFDVTKVIYRVVDWKVSKALSEYLPLKFQVPVFGPNFIKKVQDDLKRLQLVGTIYPDPLLGVKFLIIHQEGNMDFKSAIKGFGYLEMPKVVDV